MWMRLGPKCVSSRSKRNGAGIWLERICTMPKHERNRCMGSNTKYICLFWYPSSLIYHRRPPNCGKRDGALRTNRLKTAVRERKIGNHVADFRASVTVTVRQSEPRVKRGWSDVDVASYARSARIGWTPRCRRVTWTSASRSSGASTSPARTGRLSSGTTGRTRDVPRWAVARGEFVRA